MIISEWIELKTDPEFFDLVWKGDKTFEIRFNDRDFKVCDFIALKETRYSASEMKAGKPLEYTGREIDAEITHVFSGFGLLPGFVILSFRITGKVEKG